MIPLEELRTALKIPAGITAEDEYLTDLEQEAVEFVQRETGEYFGPIVDDAVFVIRGTGERVLYLPQRATAVTSVLCRPYLGGSETTIGENDADGWALQVSPGETHSRMLVRRGAAHWWFGTEYVVTATIGYTAGLEPRDVRKIVRDLVILWFEQRLPVALGTVAPPVPMTAAAMLKSRRRVLI